MTGDVVADRNLRQRVLGGVTIEPTRHLAQHTPCQFSSGNPSNSSLVIGRRRWGSEGNVECGQIVASCRRASNIPARCHLGCQPCPFEAITMIVRLVRERIRRRANDKRQYSNQRWASTSERNLSRWREDPRQNGTLPSGQPRCRIHASRQKSSTTSSTFCKAIQRRSRSAAPSLNRGFRVPESTTSPKLRSTPKSSSSRGWRYSPTLSTLPRITPTPSIFLSMTRLQHLKKAVGSKGFLVSYTWT